VAHMLCASSLPSEAPHHSTLQALHSTVQTCSTQRAGAFVAHSQKAGQASFWWAGSPMYHCEVLPVMHRCCSSSRQPAGQLPVSSWRQLTRAARRLSGHTSGFRVERQVESSSHCSLLQANKADGSRMAGTDERSCKPVRPVKHSSVCWNSSPPHWPDTLLISCMAAIAQQIEGLGEKRADWLKSGVCCIHPCLVVAPCKQH